MQDSADPKGSPEGQAEVDRTHTVDRLDSTVSSNRQGAEAATTLPGRPQFAPAGEALVGGRYTIVDEIDRGGMGVVYRAIDADMQRPLAVKVLLARDEPGGLAEERFLAEARITGQLQHPGIAPVHEIGRLEDGRPFFAMKLIAGRTLADLLKERSSPASELPNFLKIFEQIAQTLAYAHSEGIIHRDLKPGNVMVGAFGEVQVMDWGLARRLNTGSGPAPPVAGSREDDGERPDDADTRPLDSSATPGERLTRHGDVMGTPAYMPPEQARGEVASLDQRSDVFGLGGILCAILTGHPPYERHEDATPLAQAVQGDVSKAQQRLAGCGADGEVIELAQTCLAPAAADRPADAGEVARRLSSYLNSVQERLKQAAIDQAAAEAKAIEERKRRRVGMALLASLVLLVTTIGGAATWYLNHRVITQSKISQATGDITASLDEAERSYADLFTVLQDSKRAYTLMDEPLIWRGKLDTALSAVGRAESLARQVEVDPELDQRIGALNQQLTTALEDHELAVRLEAIRLQASAIAGGKWDPSLAAPVYQTEFRAADLPILTGDPSGLASRIQQSSIHPFIVAALDHWAGALSEGEELARVLEVARRADPESWRDRVRTASNWSNLAELQALVDDCDVAEQSPQILVLLAWRMRTVGVDSTPFLLRVQRRYPSDYWVNLTLGDHARDLNVRIAFDRAALAIRPESIAAWNNLGSTYFSTKDFDGAIDAFRQALAINPEFAFAQHNLGNALAANGDMDGAMAAFRQALKIDPEYVESQSNLGNTLQAKGRLDDAIAAYHEAIRMDSTHANAHSNLGTAFMEKGNLDDAIDSFRRALELVPQDATTNNDLGSALHARGDLDDAIAVFHQAIEIDPQMVQAHVNLGIAQLSKGNADAAVAANRRALELDAQNVDAHYGLGNGLRARNDLDEAIAAYRQTLALNPNFAQAHNNLGNALSAKGDMPAAIAAYRRALAIDPKLRQSQSNLGVALAMTGDLDGAIEVFQNALKLNPNDAGLHYSLGLALSSNGDVDGAMAAYRQALALDPDQAEAHCNLAHLLRQKGRFGDSLQEFRRGHEIGSKRTGWPYPSATWVAEAEQIEAANRRLPDVLSGEASPADTREHLQMAHLLFHYKKEFKHATRFYAEAFKVEPKQANDLQAGHRYNAVCAAAMAIAELEENESADERDKWLEQARTWLQADLDAWTKLLDENPQAALLINHTLERWQADRQLASVRGESVLATIPADEQDAWRKLWADVQSLHTRSSTKNE